MPVPVVIFDLDGTLLDTLEDLAWACNRVLAVHGYPAHPVEKYRYFVGDGLATLIERIVPEETDAAARTSCLEAFNRIYAACWHNISRPYPGVEKMLHELRQAGCSLAILSNKPHAFTRVCVDHFFGEQTFAAVFGQREGVPKKPDPHGALEIAGLLHRDPDVCLYVGDTRVDMQTGTAAGMKTIGVLWGFRDRAELLESGADLVVSEPAELTRAVFERARIG